jgi:hypothetical protein
MSAADRLKRKAAKLYTMHELMKHAEREATIRRSNAARGRSLWKQPTLAQKDLIAAWEMEAGAFDYWRSQVLAEHARTRAVSLNLHGHPNEQDIGSLVTYQRALAVRNPAPKRALDEAGKAEIVADFKAWTGGWGPAESDDVARLMYLENALPVQFDRAEVEPWLRGLQEQLTDVTRCANGGNHSFGGDGQCLVASCEVWRCLRCGGMTNDPEVHQAIEHNK